MLLAHQFIDLIVQVADLEIAEGGILDLCDFSRDFFEDLRAPFFARGDRCDARYEFWSARARYVDYACFGSLRGAEAEEHRMRLFGVARHDCSVVFSITLSYRYALEDVVGVVKSFAVGDIRDY